MAGILNVSEAASIALHGLAIIAHIQPNRMNVKKLASKLNASEAHVAKVFQKLSKANLVKSFRGPTGGFALNVKSEDVTFLDIYEIIESKIELAECPLKKTGCTFKKCIFGGELMKISMEIRTAFENIRLSDFIESEIDE